MFAEEIKKSLETVLKKLEIKAEVKLEHPAELMHGDYATSVALVAAKSLSKKPRDLAEEIVEAWQEMGWPKSVEKVEVAGPGFINIWLKIEALSTETQRVLRQANKYGSSNLLKGKKILLEHTSPNPQTTIMLGHLRNNFLGMSMDQILSFSGAKVTLDEIVNDRGVHISRAIWGYLVFAQKRTLAKKEIEDFKEVEEEKIEETSRKADWKKLLQEWRGNKKGWWQPEELALKPDHANLVWYVLGSRAYGASAEVKKQVEEILIAWEKEEKAVRELWRQLLDWVEEGYRQTYERIGSRHDWDWYESDHWQEGKEIVKEGLKKGVFRKSKGAIVSSLERLGLPDTVIVKSDGTSLYITQDLALTRRKKEKFPSDLYIWDIGAEQTLYFKQLFAIVDQLRIIDKNKLLHFSYALINFKGGGKMATRRGDVVKADEILDELQSRALKIIKAAKRGLADQLGKKEIEGITEKVALGAIKYSLLKYARGTTIFFDFNESLALQGNSGPYLQYTYARTQSVLLKAQSSKLKAQKLEGLNLSLEEKVLLRTIYRFPEVICEAAESFSPNLLCNFLFDLAQKFNLFYDRRKIIGSSTQEFRLLMTASVGQVLKNGLTLLGIEPLARM